MRPKRTFSPKELNQIAELVGQGVPVRQLAAFLGMSRRHFFRIKNANPDVATAYAKGSAVAEFRVAEVLYQLAVIERSLPALIWYEKTRLGRSEKQEVSHQNKECGQILSY